jgi:catalase
MKSFPHLCSAAAAAACLLAAAPGGAQGPDPEAIADAFEAVSGKHPGARLSGAKGVCVSGSFAPSPEAAGLSEAPHFAAEEVPVTGRFSMGGGNPKVSDKTKAVTRGFAVRMGGGEAGDLVLVMISAPVFVARTPEQLMGLLAARVPAADGKPDPEKVKAFAAANPETTRQAAWLNARPVPASFAGVGYWGVHAFTLTDAGGEATVAKLKAVPAAGALSLGDEELQAKPDSFYADELKDRLGRGPAAFDLVAVLGQAGDPTDDATAAWPEEDRESVRLGTISIAAIEPDATCDAATFDPVDLPDGVAGPAADPMFEIRSPTYAVALSRRAG